MLSNQIDAKSLGLVTDAVCFLDILELLVSYYFLTFRNVNPSFLPDKEFVRQNSRHLCRLLWIAMFLHRILDCWQRTHVEVYCHWHFAHLNPPRNTKVVQDEPLIHFCKLDGLLATLGDPWPPLWSGRAIKAHNKPHQRNWWHNNIEDLGLSSLCNWGWPPGPKGFVKPQYCF